MTATPQGGLPPRRVVIAIAALVAVLMIAGAVSFVRYAGRNAPNPNRIAVAPFDIFVPAADLESWRVTLAERLTEALAAAPLETVPQSAVRERWRSAPRPEIAAVELARRSSAGTAIYGRVDPASGDSVRVRLIVADAASSRVLFAVVRTWPPTDPAGLARALAGQVRAHHPVTRAPPPPP